MDKIEVLVTELSNGLNQFQSITQVDNETMLKILKKCLNKYEQKLEEVENRA